MVKSFKKRTGGGPWGGSIGSRIGGNITWTRRFWGEYYYFEYEWDAFCIRAYKRQYDPISEGEVLVLVHTFTNDIIHEWSKRPDAENNRRGT